MSDNWVYIYRISEVLKSCRTIEMSDNWDVKYALLLPTYISLVRQRRYTCLTSEM